MDTSNIKKQVVFHCAAVIMGLKCANLLVLKKESSYYAKKLLEGSAVSCRVLYENKKDSVLYFYRCPMLEERLKDEENLKILDEFGYPRGLSTSRMLDLLSSAYSCYRTSKTCFPHEMGVFLGYPAKDVIGFIAHDGRDELFTGYWKVYDNAPEKQKLFDTFDKSRLKAMQMLEAGMNLSQFLKEKKNDCSILVGNR